MAPAEVELLAGTGAPIAAVTSERSAAARDNPDADLAPLVLQPPSNPMAVARELVGEQFTKEGILLLRAWRGGFRSWNGSCWPEIDEATVRAQTYEYLEHAWYEARGELRPWAPTKAKVANVIEAMKAVTHLRPTIQPPAWLAGDDPDPRDLLVVGNGILHIPTLAVIPQRALGR